MLPYEFHSLAARELDEAVERYEEISPGKGLEFAGCVRTAIEQVCDFPEIGADQPRFDSFDSRATELTLGIHGSLSTQATTDPSSRRGTPEASALLLVWQTVESRHRQGSRKA